MKRKVIHGIIGCLFLAFALVQLNDPDPLKWVIAYAVVVVCAILAIIDMPNKWIALLGVGIGIFGIVFLLPEFINWLQLGAPSIVEGMKAEEPHIEFTREFMGYILIGSVAFYYYRLFKKRSKK